MNRRDGNFTAQGGVRLHWQAWEPDEGAKASLLVVHGYGEHGGRYGHLVDHFVPLGYEILALDQRGHGRSGGPRGHVGRFPELVADLHAFRVRVEEERKGRPLFLIGHSMGGLIAVHYALAHAAGLAGLVLSSPALGLADPPGAWRRALAGILSVVAPRVSFHGNVEPALLSRDASVGRAYAADPLVHSRVTARFFTELEGAIEEAAARAPELTLPLLVLQAGEDRLVDPTAAEAFVGRVSSEDHELRVYPGYYHEIFNEIGKERVFADLQTWIEHRIPG